MLLCLRQLSFWLYDCWMDEWQKRSLNTLKPSSLWCYLCCITFKGIKTCLQNLPKGKYIQKQRHYFADKGPSSQGYGFSCGHLWMWELDCEEGRAPKDWCFWTVVLEKTLESPLDSKEIQPVHSEGDQLWDFFGRNDAKAETPVPWPPHAKSWLIGKDSDAGREWGQEEKGMTEDEMAGWHHWLDGHESEWTPGVGDGQGGLECCDSWGRKESDMTERLIWTERRSNPINIT